MSVVRPVEPGMRDPAEDIKFLGDELDFWYLSILKKTWDKFSRAVVQTHGEVSISLQKQFSGLGSTEDIIKELLKSLGLQDKRLTEWSEVDLMGFASALRKKTKPMIIAAK